MIYTVLPDIRQSKDLPENIHDDAALFRQQQCMHNMATVLEKLRSRKELQGMITNLGQNNPWIARCHTRPARAAINSVQRACLAFKEPNNKKRDCRVWRQNRIGSNHNCRRDPHTLFCTKPASVSCTRQHHMLKDDMMFLPGIRKVKTPGKFPLAVESGLPASYQLAETTKRDGSFMSGNGVG